MNAVIYARYSCDKQKEESIEGQLRDCYAYAKSKNITVIGEYIDKAYSAKTDNRPSFQQMIADSMKRRFEVIIMWKTDRFARNKEEAAINRAKFKRNGVKILYAKEEIPEGPAGILIEGVLDSFAEFYSADLSEKVTRGMKESALKGKSLGSKPPFGYQLNESNQYILNPETVPLVKQIFEMYIQGNSTAEICRIMNNLKIKTAYGNKFGKSSLIKMLHNEMYIGTYKRMGVTIENGVPAIIEPEKFQKVQEILKVNAKHSQKFHKDRADYILSGKLYCGICESQMNGHSGTGKSGTKHYYYTCKGKKEKHCDKTTVRKGWIEDLVINETNRIVLEPDAISYIAEMIEKASKNRNDKNERLQMLTGELASVEKSLNSIMTAIEAGIFSKTTQSRLVELEEKQEILKTEIEEERSKNYSIPKDKIKKVLKRMLKEKDNEEARGKIIHDFVHKCFLFEDRLIIAYNITDFATNELMKSEIMFLTEGDPQGEKGLHHDFQGSPEWTITLIEKLR